MQSRAFLTIVSLLTILALAPGRALAIGSGVAIAAVASNSSLEQLNAELKTKKDSLRDLQDRIDTYNRKIVEAQSRAASLANQISIIDDSVEKTQLNIQTKELEIEQLDLEIEIIQKEIEAEESRVHDTRNKIGTVLQTINQYDNKGAIAVVFSTSSLSDVVDQIYYSETLNTRLRDRLDTMQSIRLNLQNNRQLLEEKKQATENARLELDDTRDSLQSERQLKNALLVDTKENEEQFQDLVKKLKSEQASVDSDIVTLEKSLRERLSNQALQQQDQTDAILSWPVSNARGISAYFHDAGYPFRYIFEHPAVDIRAYQGTPIGAAASGYVARAKDAGMGYSYIMVVHANGFATVYGHVSRINVTEGSYVTRGQIIGYSGGKPGTPGAGSLTTGPHLHFEVRLNGIPVDPLKYLP